VKKVTRALKSRSRREKTKRKNQKVLLLQQLRESTRKFIHRKNQQLRLHQHQLHQL
jgi:hypothetical protein